MQDFKDEQKEVEVEWIKDEKIVKRKRETIELDLKKELNRKEKNGVKPQKPSRCQQKRTQVWMKTYLCWRKTELKQSYIPII